jgi:hypothetical protein
MPFPIYSRGRSPKYPLDRRLSGPQSWSGWYGEVKILYPTGTPTPTPTPSPQPVTIPTALLQLFMAPCNLGKNGSKVPLKHQKSFTRLYGVINYKSNPYLFTSTYLHDHLTNSMLHGLTSKADSYLNGFYLWNLKVQ